VKQEVDRLPLRERNRQRTIQRIVEAAIELFYANGYDQTTMDLIAEKAEVSRATLFNYFSTKQALLLPFANDLYEKNIQPRILSYLEEQPATLDVLRFLFMSIYEQVLTLPEIERGLRAELFQPHSAIKDIGHGHSFSKTLLTIIQQGQRRGEIRTDIPDQRLGRYIGALYFSLLRLEFKENTSTNYVSEIDTLLVFLKDALSQTC
jgi:AcrR family transcriptional regulator